jgi:hypothetical protein
VLGGVEKHIPSVLVAGSEIAGDQKPKYGLSAARLWATDPGLSAQHQ